MIRRKLFLILLFFHTLLDRGITICFGVKGHQRLFRLSHNIRVRLFPEYGPYIPNKTIRSPQKKSMWITPEIPDWVLQEMQYLGRDIDPILYPNDAFLATCKFYSFPVAPKPGQVYAKILQQCSVECYTHCFAIPWLKQGGADLVSLKHIEFANKQPGAKVLVMLTEPGDSPWLNRVPEGVDVLLLSEYVSEILHEEILLVIVRLLVQLKIDVLHIINSRHTWEVVCKYGLAIKQNTKIFASIYCDDIDIDGQPVGFARQYLGQCYKHLTRVFSDNAAFPLLLQQTYGYNPELFVILKSPTNQNALSVRNPIGNRVLWAGRIDRQKRPDLLLQIAENMPTVEFHVYGNSVLESKSKIIEAMKKTENIILQGGFDGAENLPFSEFPVFLYTSQWDGTPTIVIAAALTAIPIVASCVGGVRDIIMENTGYPILDIEDISAYIRGIEHIFSYPEEAKQRGLAAQRFIQKEYTQQKFEFTLLNTAGYCKTETHNEAVL